MALDKHKYFDVLKFQGASAALTLLHRDMALVEYQAFEGDRRTEPAFLAELNAMRDFSRELWDAGLKLESSSS
jgi:hypothetical protein